MLISKTDLTKAASRFSRIPSGEQLFNPFEDVKCLDGSIYYPDVIWLMGNCPKLQTNEGLGGYIATKPSAFYIYLLMAECRFAQTPLILLAFLEAKPDAHVLAYFRRDCMEFANKPEVIAALEAWIAHKIAEPEPTPEPEPTTSPATSCLHEGVLLVAALREYRRAYGKDGANTAGVQVAVDIALDRFKAAVSRLQVESRKRVADANFEKTVIDAIEIAQAAIVITHRASNKKAAVAAVDQAVRKLPYLIKYLKL